MTTQEIYAAVQAGYRAAIAAAGLGSYEAQGTGVLTIADRVLARDAAATVDTILAAIVADRRAVVKKALARLDRTVHAPARRRAKLLADLADLRADEARALSTDAELAR